MLNLKKTLQLTVKFMTKVATKVKVLENNADESGVKELNEPFNRFSNNMTTKIDRLSEVVEKAVSSNARDIPTQQTFSAYSKLCGKNLARDNSTGLFSRINMKQTEDRSHPMETLSGTTSLGKGVGENHYERNGERGDSLAPPAMESDTAAARPIPVVGRPSNKPKGFKGVLRKRVRKYFLTGIAPESTENNLQDFLTENDVVHTEIRFFKGRRSDSISAKVIIWEENRSYS